MEFRMKNGCLIDFFRPCGTYGPFGGRFPSDKSLGYFRSPLTGLGELAMVELVS
jgi:hypothetical protein